MNNFDALKKSVDQYISDYCGRLTSAIPERGSAELVKAMNYSILDAGHRVRPLLSLLTAKALGASPEGVLPFGCAVELVHGYSLVHDDLPCMDDDDLRRGKPANHKVFGEALAVLAGDALLAEAFLLLTQAYGKTPSLAVELTQDLAWAASARGLAGGQAADLVLRPEAIDVTELELLHRRKTGALLRLSIMGAAKIASASPAQREALELYASALGLAFQVADDVADGKDGDELSFVKTIGLDSARQKCQKLVNQARGALANFGEEADGLRALADSIYERTQDAGQS